MNRGSGFRRRLTLTFMAVAAISAGSLAILSFLLVKQDRLDSFTQRSLDKAQLAQSVAESRTSEPPNLEEIEELSHALKRRADIEIVVRTEEHTFSSLPGVDVETAFRAFSNASRTDGMTTYDFDTSDTNYFVVDPTGSEEPTMLFLFSRANVLDQLGTLSGVLWRVWGVLLLSSAVVGHLVARRTLRPIARAGEAATALAEGMLDTRLPSGRSDEFGTWATSFNRMATALQEKIQELEESAERERRFTSDVAHELRTPLSALVTSAEMLSSAHQEMGPDARWAAGKLSSQVKRMRRLVEELLEISRLDSGREALTFVDASLADLIRRLLSHHGWSESVDAQIEDAEISTDPRRLDRIVGNLIANGIEHGGGLVTIQARLEKASVVIDVQDQGSGIEPNDERRVFDRFFKSNAARGGGSGLGLAIARENARLLGGEITATSTPTGATFTVRLPRVRAAGSDVPSRDWRPISKLESDETVTSRSR